MRLEKILRLRARWAAEGYELPELQRPKEELEGLGDLIHLGLKKIGISGGKSCGCEKRRQTLNRLVPFKKSTDAVLPTDDRRNED